MSDSLRAIVKDLRTVRSVSLSSMVMLIYDIILTFPDEVEYVWRTQRRPAKYLYILSRYPALFALVLWQIYDFGFSGSMYKFCVVAGYITPWLTWLITIPIQVVLILRTLAVWERDAKVAGFLAVLSISYNAIMLVCNIILTTSYHYQRNIFVDQLHDCYSALPAMSPVLTRLVFGSLISYDGIMFFLVVFQAFRSGLGIRARILVILVRDGAIYYSMIFAFSIASLTMTTILEVPRNSWALMNSVGPALLVVYSVSASHLILNLRKHVDKLESPTGLYSGIHFADSSGLTIMDELNYRSPDVHGSSLVSMEHDNL